MLFSFSLLFSIVFFLFLFMYLHIYVAPDARMMVSNAVLEWVEQQPYGLYQPYYPGQIYTNSYLAQLDAQIKAFAATTVSDKARMLAAIETWTDEFMLLHKLTNKSEFTEVLKVLQVEVLFCLTDLHHTHTHLYFS